MNFILSPEIIDDIIFAMENQNDVFVFDAAAGFCVSPAEQAQYAGTDGNEDRFYMIPAWTPADGFRVMEQFTARVHNPVLRELLRAALERKKGVFRLYKNVLKAYPAAGQDWHRFKERQMKAAVYEWYNDLRTVWGLEKIRFEEEETDSLLHQDFTFELHTGISDDLLCAFRLTAEGAGADGLTGDQGQDAGFDAGTRAALDTLAHKVLPAGGALRETVVITVHAGEEVCALCMLYTVSPRVLILPLLRVLPDYRGLGIGKELLRRACTYAARQGAALIFADLGTAGYFIPQLERHGFRPAGLLYVKDIFHTGS
ncbi:MAG: UPF0158 family protein [Treponema sp.]